jgi:hypothetical protein
MTFNATDRKQAEAWQKAFRAKLAELVGGFPKSAAAPVAEMVEVRDFPEYKRQRFFFESRPGVKVAGYLLTPKAGKAPYATVVCVPGHGRGADDIVGIDEKGRDRTDKAGYQHDFAIQVAEQGMAAVAIEPMAFGCRRDPITSKKGQGTRPASPPRGRIAAGRDDDRLARVRCDAHHRLDRHAAGAGRQSCGLHGNPGRRHVHSVFSGAGYAHQGGNGERLSEHVPR